MYFSDPFMLEKSLHNDLNTIIKSIKIRQDQHLQLLDYNRGVVTKQRDIQADIFINDQLVKHKTFLVKIKYDHQQLQTQQNSIRDKYSETNLYNDDIAKLMARVGARILQMLQNSLDKIKIITQQVQDRHKKMKNSLLKTLNQKDKIQIKQMLNIVINYIHQKVAEQLIKLQKMINILEEGQPQKLQSFYQKKLQKKKSLDLKKRDGSQVSVDLKKQKQKIKQRINQLKQQSKQNDKIKKQKNKFAQKMLTQFYSGMDISKNQFIENMVFINQQQKYKKLYQQIVLRNKYNYQQIIAFEAKSQSFYQKVRKFKQMMINQRNNQQQAVIIKAVQRKQSVPLVISNDIPKTQDPQQKQVFKQQKQKEHIYPDSQKLIPDVQLLPLKFPQKSLRSSMQKAQSPRIVRQQNGFYSMQSSQQVSHHLKFNTKQQQVYLRTNRARLPQIPNRTTPPTQNMHYINRKSIAKQQQKAQIINNININGQSQKFNLPYKQSNNSTRHNFQKSRQKKQSLPKNFQYTFYIKKRTNKFYETKNNFIL